MSVEVNLFNVIILILLSLLIENALRKIGQEKSRPVTRSFWFLLFPSYILATISTINLLILQPSDNSPYLMAIQKYTLGAHLLACLLFIAAVDGARTYEKVKRERLATRSLRQ